MPPSPHHLKPLLEQERYEELFDLLLPEISTKATTRANTLSGWRNYVKWLQETGESLLNFGRPEIAYLEWLKAQEAAPSTLNNRLLQVRKLYGLLLERELIERNPFKGTHMVHNPVHERREIYSQEDVERLLTHADAEDSVMVLLGADAGLSGGEARFLKFIDITEDAQGLQIWRVRYRETDFQPIQVVPCTERLRIALLQWMKDRGATPLYGEVPQGYVLGQDEKPIADPELLSRLYHLCRKANVEYKAWRALRHVAGVQKLKEGADRTKIQNDLGLQRLDPLIRKTGVEDGRKLRWKKQRERKE